MTVSKKILAIFIFFDIIKKYQLILILEVIYMISKKLVASLLLLGMSLNNCSAKDNSKLSILKNAGFTIGGITAGVLGTLLIHKIASKDEDKKQNSNELSDNNEDKKQNSNELSDNNKVNFQLGEPLFRIMFTDGCEKYYIKSLDKRFDILVSDDKLNELVNRYCLKNGTNEKFRYFCKKLDLNSEDNYQPKSFYERLRSHASSCEKTQYLVDNFYMIDVLEHFDPFQFFCEVRETSEKDKLFLWFSENSIRGLKLGISFPIDFSILPGLADYIEYIEEFIKKSLKIQCIKCGDVKDKDWLRSQKFKEKAEEIKKYFIKNEKK